MQVKILFWFQELPFDVSVCVFVLEQALSVRALQEMVSAKSQEDVRSHFVTSKFKYIVKNM